MIRPSAPVGPLALVALMALSSGCTWWGGGEESRTPDGPYVAVLVRVLGSRDIDVNLQTFEGGPRTRIDSFTAEGDATTERNVPVNLTSTVRLQLDYAMDDQGRGARGVSETTIDPAACDGVYEVTFVLDSRETPTTSGNSGACRAA